MRLASRLPEQRTPTLIALGENYVSSRSRGMASGFLLRSLAQQEARFYCGHLEFLEVPAVLSGFLPLDAAAKRAAEILFVAWLKSVINDIRNCSRRSCYRCPCTVLFGGMGREGAYARGLRRRPSTR